MYESIIKRLPDSMSTLNLRLHKNILENYNGNLSQGLWSTGISCLILSLSLRCSIYEEDLTLVCLLALVFGVSFVLIIFIFASDDLDCLMFI